MTIKLKPSIDPSKVDIKQPKAPPPPKVVQPTERNDAPRGLDNAAPKKEDPQ